MAKKDKKKKQADRQKQWEEEVQLLDRLSKLGPKYKPLARSRGYDFKYFDLLDSNEAVFKEIAESAASSHPSLVAIREVPWDDFRSVNGVKYGVDPIWQHATFRDGDEGAITYNDADPSANINGVTQAYLTPESQVRTLVLIPQSVRCDFQHRDLKYHFKLIALLHELGHVDDFEKQVNFNFASRSADIISAEVYAHRHALDEANRLGLFAVATTLKDSLKKYLHGTDYRTEVARRVLDAYQPPSVKTWQELTGWGS